jgi:hypothetical protein
MRTITSDQDLTDYEKELMSLFGGVENLVIMCGATNFTAPDDSGFYSWIRFEIEEKLIMVSRALNRTVCISLFAEGTDPCTHRPDKSCRCGYHDVPKLFARVTGYHLDF